MSEYLDVIEKETKTIIDIAYEMNELSLAFYATGNMTMGDTLRIDYEQLMKSQKSINNAVAADINGRFNQAEQSAFNTVAACLAMSEIKGT